MHHFHNYTHQQRIMKKKREALDLNHGTTIYNLYDCGASHSLLGFVSLLMKIGRVIILALAIFQGYRED